MRLHHLALKANDPAALAAFYREVLGMEEITQHQDDEGLRSVWLRLGEGILMVERAGAEGPAPGELDPPGLHLLALTIAPEEAPRWRTRLTITHETTYTLYARDPEGNRLGLSSHPEPLGR